MNFDVGLPALSFSQAASRWLDWQKLYVKEGTVGAYEYYIGSLERFFHAHKLQDIHAGHLREYQITRTSNAENRWPRVAGPSVVNHELNTLSQILERAGLWAKLKSYYKPLPMPRWTPPRVMTQAEEDALFEVAVSNPRLELAWIGASITNNTTASGVELRCLQIKNVRLEAIPYPEVHIPSESVKNEFRARRIPLNETALLGFQKALKRANRLGCTSPEHYLFPFREKKGKYDPKRPGAKSWMRAQFEEMRELAGLPWLRPHDLRHQCITRMLEAGAPDQTVMSIAGHVSKQMLEHYSHIRMEAKMSVLQKINPGSFTVAQMRQKKRA